MMRLHPDFLRLPLTHRALHDVVDGRPENSIEAILAAIDHGYGIEVDVQLSADNQAMVYHDYDLDRLTHEHGDVRDFDAAKLAEITLAGGTMGMPTLGTVLGLVDGAVPLMIELKDQDGQLGKNVGLLEQATAAMIADYQGPLAVMSFNPHSVAAMAELSPNVPRGIVTDPFTAKGWPHVPEATRMRLANIPDYDRVGACFISHQVADLASGRVADIKSKGADVFCWSVRSPQQEAFARQYAQNITFEQYLAPFLDLSA